MDGWTGLWLRPWVQPQTPLLCLPRPGPHGPRCGHALPKLGRDVSLRLAASSNHHIGPQQAPSPQRGADSDHLGFASQTLVHGSPGALHRAPSPPTSIAQSPQAGQVGPLSPGPGHAPPPCLESVQLSLQQEGFLGYRARRTPHPPPPKATSTLGVYNRKWRIICSWCLERNQDPLSATIPVIADFLRDTGWPSPQPSDTQDSWMWATTRL